MQRHASLHKAKRNIRRVDTEVRALKRFSHTAVVRLHDVIQSPSYVHLVLERGDRDLYAFLDDYKDGCTEDVVIVSLNIEDLHVEFISTAPSIMPNNKFLYVLFSHIV